MVYKTVLHPEYMFHLIFDNTMKLSIEFESLDRIDGQEGRSKLLAKQSALYQTLKRLKEAVKSQYQVKPDRMDLHIEITKERRDPQFREKAESIHLHEVDLSDTNNWDFLGRAFVLWTPEVAGYGRTHITIAFFGNFPKPTLSTLQALALEAVTT